MKAILSFKTIRQLDIVHYTVASAFLSDQIRIVQFFLKHLLHLVDPINEEDAILLLNVHFGLIEDEARRMDDHLKRCRIARLHHSTLHLFLPGAPSLR